MFLQEHNRPVTPYDVVELFGRAYIKCQPAEIVANGFKIGGIYPFNRNIFTEADYIAAAADVSEDQTLKRVQARSPHPWPLLGDWRILMKLNQGHQEFNH